MKVPSNQMDDYDEDILWEDDVEGAPAEVENGKRQRVDDTTLLPVNALNGETTDKRRPLREFLQQNDIFTALSHAKTELIAGVKRVIALSDACNHQELQAILLSICPERSCTETSREYRKKLITWFGNLFAHVKNGSMTPEEGRDGSSAEELLRILLNPSRKEGEKYRGSAIQMTQLLTALMRVNSFTCRLVMTVDTCSMNPMNHVKILENIHRRRNKKAEINFRVDSEESNEYLFRKEYRINPRFKEDIEPSAWCEIEISRDEIMDTAAVDAGVLAVARIVPVPSHHSKMSPVKSNEVISLLDSGDESDTKLPAKRPLQSPASHAKGHFAQSPTMSKQSPADKEYSYPWEAVDTVSGFIDDIRKVEHKIGRNKANKIFQYIFGVDENGILVDVSCIYSSQYEKMLSIRHPEAESIVYQFNNELANRNLHLLGSIDMQRAQVSEFSKQFVAYDRMKVGETVPSSIDGFKKHPTFVLESHINSQQALVPGAKAIGTFKSQKYYRRQDACDLYTRSIWKSKFRKQVKDNEFPIKEVTRKEKVVGLFGPWQTEDYQREVVVDDEIPVNSFGNVEVFDGDERFLPIGTTLLAQHGVSVVAKQLGLPCKQAIIGFSVTRGHSHPTPGGYVVLTKHVDLILDGLNTVIVDRNEKEVEKKQREINKKWEGIVHRYTTFKELMNKY